MIAVSDPCEIRGGVSYELEFENTETEQVVQSFLGTDKKYVIIDGYIESGSTRHREILSTIYPTRMRLDFDYAELEQDPFLLYTTIKGLNRHAKLYTNLDGTQSVLYEGVLSFENSSESLEEYTNTTKIVLRDNLTLLRKEKYTDIATEEITVTRLLALALSSIWTGSTFPTLEIYSGIDDEDITDGKDVFEHYTIQSKDIINKSFWDIVDVQVCKKYNVSLKYNGVAFVCQTVKPVPAGTNRRIINSDGTYAGSTQLINVVDISGYTDRSRKQINSVINSVSLSSIEEYDLSKKCVSQKRNYKRRRRHKHR